jgi:DHA2 family multidrug resistance protein
MPVTGLLIARVDPRKLLGAGFLLGAWTMFWLGEINLAVGYWDVFWPQFVQGIALGLLFVPLTTITMDRIPRERMGNATSLFNLMRNIGGSAGIAIVETVLANQRQLHTNILGSHIDAYGIQNQQLLAGLKAAFIARGADAATATQQAYAAAFGMVQQQAAILSFIDAFRLLGIAFLVFAPLILFMRRPTHATEHPTVAPD